MLAKYPVKKVTLPSDLEGIKNGEVPANLLANIQPYGQLHKLAAQAWEAMRLACKAETGFDLSHVGANRTIKEQIALFESRYSKKDKGRKPQVTRVWNGTTYFLLPGMAPAGSPGTSNHGWSLAVDVAVLVNKKVTSLGAVPKVVEWLEKNILDFGFSWEVEDPKNRNFELWHVRYFPGDKVPARVSGAAVAVPDATKVAKPNRKEKKGRKVKEG